jgi:hypothetical protein
MKKNKLLVSVTTIKVYEYKTNAETSDVAFDEYLNQSGKRHKLVEKIIGSLEIYDFKTGGKNDSSSKDIR